MACRPGIANSTWPDVIVHGRADTGIDGCVSGGPDGPCFALAAGAFEDRRFKASAIAFSASGFKIA
jgi:hypothetical protein